MNKLLVLLFGLMIPMTVIADDNNQSELRQNPNIAVDEAADSIVIPAYVDLGKNHIIFNGDDWTELRQRFAESDSSRFTVLHIGDSHLQADMGTAVVRRALGVAGGYAGRGLTVPFKLAGTNEPVDYWFTSPSSDYLSSRLLKMPWPTQMGATGIAVTPQPGEFEFTVSTPGQPFDNITLITTGNTPAIKRVLADSVAVRPEIVSGGNGIDIILPAQVQDVTITLDVVDDSALQGVSLTCGDTGVLYHVIGNNGATYSTYNLVPTMGRDVALLDPDLVIISLGTNEAFGRYSDEALNDDMSTLLSSIKRTCPDAKILLTTPAECQRSVKHRRKKMSYAVNSNIAKIRNFILKYAKKHGIPVYDWYAVAGGNGSSSKWLVDKTLNTDRVHLTRKGYEIQGTLNAEALLDALSVDSIDD